MSKKLMERDEKKALISILGEIFLLFGVVSISQHIIIKGETFGIIIIGLLAIAVGVSLKVLPIKYWRVYFIYSFY